MNEGCTASSYFNGNYICGILKPVKWYREEKKKYVGTIWE